MRGATKESLTELDTGHGAMLVASASEFFLCLTQTAIMVIGRRVEKHMKSCSRRAEKPQRQMTGSINVAESKEFGCVIKS